MAFDIGGKAILEDAFSAVLDKLISKSQAAEQALKEMGTSLDASGTARGRVAQLTAEVERLQAKARSGQKLDLLDVEQFRAAKGELASINSTLAEMEGKAARVNTAAGKSGTGMNLLGGAMGLIGGYIGVRTITNLGRTAFELGQLGAQSLAAKASLAALVGGTQQAAALTEKLSVAVEGTVDRMALAQSAARALVGVQGELKQSLLDATPTLAGLAEALTSLQPQLGTTTQVFEGMIQSIRKGQTRMLEGAGIFLDQEQVYNEFGATIGKVGTDLNDTEKSLALLLATMRLAPGIIKDAATEADNLADSSERVRSKWRELKAAIGEGLAPGTATLSDQLAEGLDRVRLAVEGDWLTFFQRNVADTEQKLKDIAASSDPQWVKDLETAFAKVDLAFFRAEVTELEKQEAKAAQTTTEFAWTAAVLQAKVYGAAEATAEWRRKLDTLNTSAANTMRAMANLRYAAPGSEMGIEFAQTTAAERQHQSRLQNIETLERAGVYTKKQAFDATVKQVQAYDALNESMKGMAASAGSADDAMSDLKSTIAKELKPSFSLAQLAPGLLPEEGAIDEHYRRLAAIAMRGGAEIEAHKVDWADTLAKIPPEVQAQGIAAMQDWARRTVIAYDKGLDFSLINTDVLKQRILDALRAASLRDAVINGLAAELNIPIAELQSAAALAGLGGGPTVTPTVSAAGAQVAGATAGGAVASGLTASIQTISIGPTLAERMNADVTASAQLFVAVGARVGETFAVALTGAVIDGVANLRSDIASAVFPAVWALVAAKMAGSGAKP